MQMAPVLTHDATSASVQAFDNSPGFIFGNIVLPMAIPDPEEAQRTVISAEALEKIVDDACATYRRMQAEAQSKGAFSM